MRHRSRRVHLPAGTLRRFRLPEPEGELTGRAARRMGLRRDLSTRLWAALMFALFTSLLYWLASSEAWHHELGPKLTVPAQPEAAIPPVAGANPSALTRAASGTDSLDPERPKPLAPALTGSALAGSPPAQTGRAPTPPARPKPALVLDGYRLRPVVEWRQSPPKRPPMMRSD